MHWLENIGFFFVPSMIATNQSTYNGSLNKNTIIFAEIRFPPPSKPKTQCLAREKLGFFPPWMIAAGWNTHDDNSNNTMVVFDSRKS